jgi:O-antigen biosynthesis protein
MNPDISISPAGGKLRFALYTSSLGNYFFNEIRDLIGAGLVELGHSVERRDERSGFAPDTDWHLVIAPHEFCELGVGAALAKQAWPKNVILFNTEQPSSHWLKLSVKHFARAAAIWDINFESTLRLCKSGYDCEYLPLGYSHGSALLQEVERLPLHSETRNVPVEIRNTSGFKRNFADRPFDLLFLGHGSTRREQYFTRHRERLQALKCYIHKPSATRPMIPGQTTQMNTVTSVGLAQRSKILLNIHHGVDTYFEWHRIVLLGIAQRTLVLTEPCTLAPPFEPNRDFVEAPLEELSQRIEYYLGSSAGQAEALKIIEHGFETLTRRCRLADMLQPLLARLTASQPQPSAAARFFPLRPKPILTPQPLRLCVVTPEVAGEGQFADCGSSQTELARTLVQAGHDVTLLHTEPTSGEARSLSHWTGHFAQAGIRYISLPADREVPVDASPACRRSYETYLWLQQQSFNVVHLAETHGIGFYALLAKNQGLGFHDTKFCLTCYAPTAWQQQANARLLNNPYDLELDFMERESVRLADALTTPTRFMADWLDRNGWKTPPLRKLRPDALSDSGAQVAKPPQPIREIVYLGPLQQSSGLELFCEALNRLDAATSLKLKLIFVGNPSIPVSQKDATYLNQNARKWGFSWNITQLRPEDLPRFFQESNRLAVLAPAAHNSCLALRQMLALGVPFIVPQGGATAEFIHPDDLGAVQCPADPVPLAQATTKAVETGMAQVRPAAGSLPAIDDWLAWHSQWAKVSEVASKSAILQSTPLVSVCLIHFNRPSLLTQALDSLRAQDYPNFEVVLVDDGSTRPDALQFLASLEPEFAQRSWRIVRQENRYLGAARNTGARNARGEYLIFMDDDNIAKPHQISTFIRAALQTGAEILTSSMDLFSGTVAPVAGQLPNHRWVFLGGATATGAIRNCFGDANGCIRAETFRRLGGFTEDYGITHEDWEFYARAALAGCHIETVPDALFWYRVAANSMIRSTSLYANLQRSLRPYLAAVPEPLRGLIHFVQGTTCSPVPEAAPVQNHEPLLRLHSRLLARAQDLMRSGQAKTAESIFIEVIESAELAGSSLVLFQTLLDVGKAMIDCDRNEIAVKLLKNALELARAGCAPRAVKEAEALLTAAKRGHSGRPSGQSAKQPFEKLGVESSSLVAPALFNSQPSSAPSPSTSTESSCDKAERAVLSAPVGPTPGPLVSIIIPCFNNLQLTKKCLGALQTHTNSNQRELILVDNASTDGTTEWLRAEENCGRVKLIVNPANAGFARGCNQGAQAAHGSLLLFLNNDTEVTNGWLSALVDAVLRDQVGAAGAKLLYANGTIQHAGIGFINGVPDHPFRKAGADAPEVSQFRELDMVTGACLMIRRELFLDLAGFDEIYRNGVEDIDLCVRARSAGFKVVYQPKSVVYHLEGQSAGRFNHVTSNLRTFFEKWGKNFDASGRFMPPREPRLIKSSQSLLLNPTTVHQPVSVTVAWEGSFLDWGSLSHVNRELTHRLTRLPELRVCRVGSVEPSGPAPAELRDLASTLVVHRPHNTNIVVRHSWPPDWRRPSCDALVVIQPWEFGALPAEWVANSQQVDEFWVPSTYVRDVYVHSGIPGPKVQIIPNGIDPAKFRPGLKALDLACRKTFKFLFVGGTIGRKGSDLLLESYFKTFTAQDDVCLVIKDFGGKTFYRGQTMEGVIKAAQSRPDAPEVIYLDSELSPDDIPGLYAACDCLVHPYRGEGFGLPILEAMACALPVIVTAGGAADDFARDEYVSKVPAERRVFGDTVSGMKLVGNGWLLEPCLPELGARMKWVFENRDQARATALCASEYVRREWTWEKAAQIAADRLLHLGGRESQRAKRTNSPWSDIPKPFELPACAGIGNLNIARRFFTAGDPRQAWAATLGCLAVRPVHPEAYLFLAEVATAGGDDNSARRCAEHARSLAPNWQPARHFLKRKFKSKNKAEWLSLPDSITSASPKQPDLTVCLITRNEEATLARCLTSIQGLASQVIVVDTGSSDRTIEIAKSFGAEVHHFDWSDDFAAARNAALEHARGDWVLILDADEELLPDQHARLKADLKNGKAIALRLPLVNVDKEAEGRSFVPRLFRNAPGVYFKGRIHEQVFPSLIALGNAWGLSTALGTAQILHHGYTKEAVKDRNKIERNLNLLRQAIAESPEDPNLVMNLGLELVRSDNLADGLNQYRLAFELVSAKPASETAPELREALLTQFTSHLYKVRAHQEIVEVLTSATVKSAGLTASLHFALGLAFFELGRFSEAAEQMRRCISTRQQPALTPINTDILSAAPFHCLAMSLAKDGNPTAAENAFRSGMPEKGYQEKLRLDYARFLAGQNRHIDAFHCLHEMVASDPKCAPAWHVGAEMALGKSDFLEFACDWTSEAMLNLPNDHQIASQRAEALLLSGQTAPAREVWKFLCEVSQDPRCQAALLFCSIVENQPVSDLGIYEPEVGPISRALIDWYQQGLNRGAQTTIKNLNGRLENLRVALPGAAALIEAALAEARAEESPVVEPCLA